MLVHAAQVHANYRSMTYDKKTEHADPPDKAEVDCETARAEFEASLLNVMPHLETYALSLTRDPAEAKDLVQDCVLRALENWKRFEAGTHIRRWLFTILRNRHVDRLRQLDRRGANIPFEDCHSPDLGRPPPQDAWIALREFERKLGSVRSCDRAILQLSVLSPLSHKEIADKLEIAEGTVRSRLSRTRAELRP